MTDKSRSNSTHSKPTPSNPDSSNSGNNSASETHEQYSMMNSSQSANSDSIRSDSRSERLQARLGLSAKQWDLLVSFILFLPYPVFILLILTQTLDSFAFIILTLIYSVIAMILNFYF